MEIQKISSVTHSDRNLYLFEISEEVVLVVEDESLFEESVQNALMVDLRRLNEDTLFKTHQIENGLCEACMNDKSLFGIGYSCQTPEKPFEKPILKRRYMCEDCCYRLTEEFTSAVFEEFETELAVGKL